MSSYEGLTQLTDHHKLYNFNALHRRSDSVESHGSVSSLSSNHSSVGGRNNGVAPPSSSGASSEMSRFRRVDPPRTLNTGGSSPARNAFLQTPRSSQPQSTLLHSTSMMEPGPTNRQQALNRSRSGSCPMVWAANGLLPVDGAKPHHHPQPNQWVYSPFAYSPRHADHRPLCGQVTGSVQYVGSQHDDCRALGGARMPQATSFLAPNRRLGNSLYDGFDPQERYPSEQSLNESPSYPTSGQRPRLSGYAAGRTGERCPSEQNLAQSPSVVPASLQRSLSTMSVNVIPSSGNSNFTSKLNCSLSRSFTSKLNDVASQRSDEVVVRPRKDSKKQNVLSPQSPYEMGLCFNVPQTGGPGSRVRRQREAIEKEVSTVKPDVMPTQKNTPFVNRSQFKHRSFENLSPASKKYSLGNAFVFGDSRQENQWNFRGDGRQSTKMKAWTPDEGRPNPNGQVNAHAAPGEVPSRGNPNGGGVGWVNPGEVKHPNHHMPRYDKRDSIDLTLTPSDSRRGSRILPIETSNRTAGEIPTYHGTRSNQATAVPTSRESINKRPAKLLQSTENRPNGPLHPADVRPSRSMHALNNARESRRSDNSPTTSSFADKFWSNNISRNPAKQTSTQSLFEAAISDMERNAGNSEATGSQPSLAQPSTFVSEVYVSIVKPRPSSGLPRERTVNLQPLGNSASLSSPIYDNLVVGPTPIGTSRSSLGGGGSGGAGGGGGGAERTLGERAPWASATAAAASARRHSNPTEKMTETSPGVRAHVASQKEQLKGLLNDMKNLHLHRDKLRTCVGQMEKDAKEKKRMVTEEGHVPTAYELERLYDANRQLKIDVERLSHEIDRHRSRPSRGKVRVDGGEIESWSCSACTFINHPALIRCECCDLPRLPSSSYAKR